MKTTLLLVVLALCCFAIGQPAPPKAVGRRGVVAAPKATGPFACPKCEMASMAPGKCPCGATLVKISGTIKYECGKCHAHAAKPGNCPKCKVAMREEVVTNTCDAYHTSTVKPGKCKTCGSKTKEKHVKTMPKPAKKRG